jgi:hypothetical protein
VAEDFNATINQVWHGSIDIHVHAGPDPVASRRFDAVELAEAARAAGMRGFIFKSHEYPTAPVAYVLNKMVPGIDVFGAISLDYEVGGLNPAALEASAKMGARKVWMPTFSADHWSRTRNNRPGIRVLHDDGRLINVIDDLLSIVQQHDMILGTGHLSTEEQLSLVKEARSRGIKTVVTHADFWIPVEAQKQMADMGAFIEHAFIICTPGHGTATAAEIAASIRTHGPQQAILSTDLGQAFNPAPAEGLRMWIAAMLREGFTSREVEVMVKDNPAGLLGLA